MNEKFDLTKILKDCPEGTKLYSTVFGDVELVKVYKNVTAIFSIEVKRSDNTTINFAKDGRLYVGYSGECILFPSKEQRDWRKFKPKKPKFDTKTLNPFDKVLVRDVNTARWRCDLFSYIINEGIIPTYQCTGHWYRFCIPYNDATKHLVGTNEEAPEYYRYWED